jgi:acetyl esterase
VAQQKSGPRLKLQVLICARTDAGADTPSFRDFAEGYLLEKRGMEWFASHYCPDGPITDPRISPAYFKDLAALPPAHIHTAEFDPLRDEAKDYADKLRAAGVPVSYTCHAGMIHHFYALGDAIPYARTAMAEAGAAIKAAMA